MVSLIARTKYNHIVVRLLGRLKSYVVLPKINEGRYGLTFATEKRAIAFARKTGKYGFMKQIDIYSRNASFSFNSENKVKKFLGGGKYFDYIKKRR